MSMPMQCTAMERAIRMYRCPMMSAYLHGYVCNSTYVYWQNMTRHCNIYWLTYWPAITSIKLTRMPANWLTNIVTSRFTNVRPSHWLTYALTCTDIRTSTMCSCMCSSVDRHKSEILTRTLPKKNWILVLSTMTEICTSLMHECSPALGCI